MRCAASPGRRGAGNVCLRLRPNAACCIATAAAAAATRSDARQDTASSADLEKRDKKIAELTQELYDLHKQKNEESQRELALHRQVKDMELDLVAKIKQLQTASAHSARMDEENETLRKVVEQKAMQFRTLSDEHQALMLEYNTTEAQLKKKKDELDDLLRRWIQQKEREAERMNSEMNTFEKIRKDKVKKELSDAAGSLDVHDDALALLSAPLMAHSSVPTRALQSFEAHAGAVSLCRFSQEGHFATGSADKTIKVWDSNARCLATLRNHSAAISALCFSPTGEHLVSGAEDSTVHIYSLQTFRSVHTLNNHKDRILDAAYSCDGSLLFTTGKDHKLNMFDAKTARCKKSVLCGSTAVAMAGFMSSCLITAHFDKTLQLRDARADLKSPSAEFETGHTAQLNGIQLHPGGSRLITFAKDHVIKEFDLRTLKEIRTFGHGDFQVGLAGCHATYSSDGDMVASGDENGCVFIWRSSGSLETKLMKGGHGGPVAACAWKPSGDELFTVGKDKHLVVWSP